MWHRDRDDGMVLGTEPEQRAGRRVPGNVRDAIDHGSVQSAAAPGEHESDLWARRRGDAPQLRHHHERTSVLLGEHSNGQLGTGNHSGSNVPVLVANQP